MRRIHSKYGVSCAGCSPRNMSTRTLGIVVLCKSHSDVQKNTLEMATGRDGEGEGERESGGEEGGGLDIDEWPPHTPLYAQMTPTQFSGYRFDSKYFGTQSNPAAHA